MFAVRKHLDLKNERSSNLDQSGPSQATAFDASLWLPNSSEAITSVPERTNFAELGTLKYFLEGAHLSMRQASCMQ